MKNNQHGFALQTLIVTAVLAAAAVAAGSLIYAVATGNWHVFGRTGSTPAVAEPANSFTPDIQPQLPDRPPANAGYLARVRWDAQVADELSRWIAEVRSSSQFQDEYAAAWKQLKEERKCLGEHHYEQAGEWHLRCAPPRVIDPYVDLIIEPSD